MFKNIKALLASRRALFLENIGIKQTILKNTFWLFLAEAIVRILGLFLVIYIVRVLGVEEYGKFAFAFSFVSIMAIFSDFGVVDTATRELSRSKNNEENFSSIFTLEVILCALMLVAVFAGSFFITLDSEIRKTIWILSVFFSSNSLFGIIFSFLRARQKMEYEALSRIFQSLANTIIVFLVIFYVPSPKNVSYGYLVSNIIILFLLLLLFSFYFQPIKLKCGKYSLDILKMSWPLSLGFMASWIYISINSVMLGYFDLIIENGWYNAASKIAIVSVIPASLIVKSFYPMLSNFYVLSREKLQKSWDYLVQSMIFLAIPIVTGVVALAPKIINTFYGSSFYPSILALQLLIFVTGISFINFPYSIMLVVADQQKSNFILMIAGAIVNTALNFLFIPAFSFYGAIISTIISSILVFFSTIVLSKRLTPIRLFNKKLLGVTLISVFSSIIMYLIISSRLVYDLNIIIVFLIGTMMFFLISASLYGFFYNKQAAH
ncbi:MAG: Polysaccharide biosynthesis protein [Parcubacteria group bacterium Licking1014_1]|nr:MAG: Polysaccharide biosynthesis protein [Parcubacteria group bacterium Licking1014_1]